MCRRPPSTLAGQRRYSVHSPKLPIASARRAASRRVAGGLLLRRPSARVVTRASLSAASTGASRRRLARRRSKYCGRFPLVAWIPFAILMFPSSEMSMIYITFTGALFPILLGTIHGVEGVSRAWSPSARTLGARRRMIQREVIMPGAAPAIVTGLAIGMGRSWFCLVTAGQIAGQHRHRLLRGQSCHVAALPGYGHRHAADQPAGHGQQSAGGVSPATGSYRG